MQARNARGLHPLVSFSQGSTIGLVALGIAFDKKRIRVGTTFDK